ncbi:hypothetical protein FACS189411_06850 [Bacteroidia bacterium]|nr:hypothetical protein FACS189411_06850 [Bacteroidia bacterium]
MNIAKLKLHEPEATGIILKETYKSNKQPWEITLEERKEKIRMSEEDYKAGRYHSTEEVFAPGETKSYQFSYSVKYPKEMTLNL